MTGSNLKKILGFLPLRVRQEDDGFDKAETNATRRKTQYMKVKSWVKKIHEKLLMAGVKVEDNADNKVTMVAVSKQQQNEPRSNKSTNYNNQRYNRPQRQERRERQETNGPPVTECSICGLIRGKNVPQECLSMDFKDRHREITSRPIFPNDCLAWIRLSLDDREKVLHNNKLHCKMCLRPLRPGARGSTCSRGHHTINNGRYGMCIEKSCEMHSTVCRTHASLQAACLS